MGTRHAVKISFALAAGALAATLAAGCSGGSDKSAQPGGSVSASSSPASPSPGGSTPASPGPSASAQPSLTPTLKPTQSISGAEMTISGTVVEGVEARCLILQTTGKDYLLMLPASIDRSTVRAGAKLVVRGRLQPGLMSYCQQGTPFMVSSLSAG
jgi:hypothetical protein